MTIAFNRRQTLDFVQLACRTVRVSKTSVQFCFTIKWHRGLPQMKTMNWPNGYLTSQEFLATGHSTPNAPKIVNWAYPQPLLSIGYVQRSSLQYIRRACGLNYNWIPQQQLWDQRKVGSYCGQWMCILCRLFWAWWLACGIETICWSSCL